MNTDIRVDVGFLDHWKTDVLISQCGSDGVLSLMRLWVFAAQNKPDGRLTNIPDSIIERIAKWRGQAGSFLSCISEVRFIERDSEGVWCLHDWEDHNPYASHAEWRRERAKAGAAGRWGKPADATSMLQASNKHASEISSMLPDATKDAPSPAPAPAPAPSPDHTNLSRSRANGDVRECALEKKKPKNGADSELLEQAEGLLQFLNARCGHQFRAREGPDERPTKNLELVYARLASGATVQDCRSVIARKCREWAGDERMKKYLRPGTLFDREKFEQYLGECTPSGGS